MTILVTGGRGFIGAAAAVALREAGFRVKAGVRGSPEATGAVHCDLDAPAGLTEAMRGVETVVHAAYGDIAAMPRQMRALLGAMDGAGAKNLIMLSSIAVYGEAEGPVDEATPPRGRLDPYGAAKVACEAPGRAMVTRNLRISGNVGAWAWTNMRNRRRRRLRSWALPLRLVVMKPVRSEMSDGSSKVLKMINRPAFA